MHVHERATAGRPARWGQPMCAEPDNGLHVDVAEDERVWLPSQVILPAVDAHGELDCVAVLRLTAPGAWRRARDAHAPVGIEHDVVAAVGLDAGGHGSRVPKVAACIRQRANAGRDPNRHDRPTRDRPTLGSDGHEPPVTLVVEAERLVGTRVLLPIERHLQVDGMARVKLGADVSNLQVAIHPQRVPATRTCSRPVECGRVAQQSFATRGQARSDGVLPATCVRESAVRPVEVAAQVCQWAQRLVAVAKRDGDMGAARSRPAERHNRGHVEEHVVVEGEACAGGGDRGWSGLAVEAELHWHCTREASLTWRRRRWGWRWR